MSRIILHRPHLGCGTERVGHALGGALVIGGEGDPDVTVIENGVVWSVGALKLIEALGDEKAVLARSRPLILDPLLGHPESSRHVTNLNLRGTIKELAQLDGGFVVSHDGIVLSACRYLDAVAAEVDVPLGLGSRHIAAANMSAVTKAVGIVVSESSVVRLFCHGHLVGEIIPELWMMDHAHLRGTVKKEQVGELTVLTTSSSRHTSPAE